jgi:hypothetical protein
MLYMLNFLTQMGGKITYIYLRYYALYSLS